MGHDKSPLAKPRHSALGGAYVVANLAGPVPLRSTPEPAGQTRRLVPPSVRQVLKLHALHDAAVLDVQARDDARGQHDAPSIQRFRSAKPKAPLNSG